MRLIRRSGEQLPKEIEDMAFRVSQILDVKIDNLTAYFGDDDFSSYPNKNYRKVAFSMNIRTGGVEEMSPADVLEIMEDPAVDHFIWISNRGWSKELIWFVWIFAHELRHVFQNVVCPEIHVKTNRLKEYHFSEGGELPQYEIPVERDADLAAKYVLERLFPSAEVGMFYRTQLGRGEERFQAITGIPGTLEYDFDHKTDELIKSLGVRPT